MIIMDRKYLEQSVDAWSRGDRSGGLSEVYDSHSAGNAAPVRKSVIAANDRAPAPFTFGGG